MDFDGGVSLGDLLKKIVPKTKPSKASIEGRRLAREILAGILGDKASQAYVSVVRTGVIVIEVTAASLKCDIHFEQKALIKKFQAAGINVRQLRVHLVPRN